MLTADVADHIGAVVQQGNDAVAGPALRQTAAVVDRQIPVFLCRVASVPLADDGRTTPSGQARWIFHTSKFKKFRTWDATPCSRFLHLFFQTCTCLEDVRKCNLSLTVVVVSRTTEVNHRAMMRQFVEVRAWRVLLFLRGLGEPMGRM